MQDETLARFRARIDARLSELAEEDSRGRSGQATVELDQQAVGRLELDPGVTRCISCAAG